LSVVNSPALWLSAPSSTFQDAALTVPAVLDNATVKGIKDLSGNNHHFVDTATHPLTLKLNIIGGLPVLRGAGAGYLENATLDIEGLFTAYAVIQSSETVGNKGYFGRWAAPSQIALLHDGIVTNNGKAQAIIKSGTANKIVTLGARGTSARVLVFQYNGSNIVGGYELSSLTTGDAAASLDNSNSGWVLGGYSTTSLMTADFGELILINGADTTAQITQMVTYLVNRWTINP